MSLVNIISLCEAKWSNNNNNDQIKRNVPQKPLDKVYDENEWEILHTEETEMASEVDVQS